MRIIVFVLFLVAVVAVQQHVVAAPERPSILVIILDDMGPADTGVYGSKVIHTPNSIAWRRRACASRGPTPGAACARRRGAHS